MDEQAVNARFRRQHGVVTRAQLRDQHCVSDGVIKHRLRTGAWIKVYPGIYRHSAHPVDWRSQAMAAVFKTDGTVSHTTAALGHRIPERPRRRGIEITVEHGRRRHAAPGVIVHQSTQIDRLDRVRIDRLPVTGLARTVLDLGAVVDPLALGAVVDALVAKLRITLPGLWDVQVRHARRGRDGCGVLREVLNLRTGEASIPLSEWSRMAARLLVSAGLPEPRLEFRVHDDTGRFLAQVDLAYPDRGLAIELDSLSSHFTIPSFQRDRSRARLLVVDGWSVLSYTWEDFVDRPQQMVDQVASVLRPSPPN